MKSIKKQYEEIVAQKENDPKFIALGNLFRIAEDLYRRLSILKMSQKKLAQKLDFSEPYISRILKGNQNLSIKSLSKIFAALGLKLEISHTEFKEEKKIKCPMVVIENKDSWKITEQYEDSFDAYTYNKKDIKVTVN